MTEQPGFQSGGTRTTYAGGLLLGSDITLRVSTCGRLPWGVGCSPVPGDCLMQRASLYHWLSPHERLSAAPSIVDNLSIKVPYGSDQLLSVLHGDGLVAVMAPDAFGFGS